LLSASEAFDHDRAKGVLIGLAAGDKNLGPIEMSLMVAESLIAKQEYDLADITDRWLGWWRRDAWDMGRVFDDVMQLIDCGVEPAAAAADVHASLEGMTAGCNGAHRVPVLAASPVITAGFLDEAARTLTARTHHHVLAQDAAVATARLCRNLINGQSMDVALSSISEGLDQKIQASVENSRSGVAGRSGYSPDTLQSALYFVTTRDDFDSALSDALEFAGPPNYCPVLVGAIAGARWGSGAIAPKHFQHSLDIERVLLTARLLVGEV
jgi:ADP-ribosyl-[dinitrogen reductase] hydrolase